MAEKNLQVLLSSIKPRLHSETFVFCTVSESEFKSLKIEPICMFRETEGVSLTVEKSAADAASLAYDGTWSLITCEVNSDLNAVGFFAAMSKLVAEAGIPLNAVSAYHHDHLFVPADRAKEAIRLLQDAAAKPLAPARAPISDIRVLITHIFNEHKGFKATGSLLTQGVALISSRFGYGLPDDMRTFYERCADVKLFDRYSILSLQKALDTDRSRLPKSWMPFCELPTGNLIAIDLSNPDDIYPIIDLDNGDFDYLVISRSFTEFLDKILSNDGTSNFWIDQKEQCGSAVVYLNNNQLRKKYQDYWSGLSEEYGPEYCKAESCKHKRIKLSVFCRRHQFEAIHKIECPFSNDAPLENFAEYQFKD
jgi:hypothetical protein